MGIIDASGLWSFVYSINFQIRKISATNPYFSCEKSLLLCWSRFGKKKHFFRKKNILSGLRSCYHKQANRKKLILPLKKYFKTLTDMVIGTASTLLFELFTFFQSAWDNAVEIWEFDATSREYSRPILPSTIERCPLLWKLYKSLFQCKTLTKEIEKGGRGVKFLVLFFFKESALSGQYWMLP